MNNVRFIIQISKGLIRDQRVRRTLMFYDVLAVLVLTFFGSTFLAPWLREHVWFFLGYWGLCAWLTLLAALLAVYDMVRLRLDEKRARRQLAEEFLAHKEDDSSHDSHPT